ncbi:uncharacterized protein N7484_006232 [Penicillium longicatenatum]|uniref:uncharacterized protein n=1 Tax=Penicillium longicatenatum TaxID=1561947 RepID=UPI002546F48E|nr:uncharacterized protein N7484_006232 [Penicillium longicatenatum]KAJ5643725.1 hypothetical protein N7484_006232 [Penicillium longicatenatum]
MATTPPPPSPSALRIPAAPRHGAGYDTFEPYPTRSSARLAGQRASKSKDATQPICPGSPSKGQSKGSPRKYRKMEEATISPPGSHPMSRNAERGTQASAGNYRQPDPQPSGRVSGSHALPTPAKTPSKKKITSDLSATARTLFPSAKMSKGRFSIDVEDASPGPQSIQIYTDSRDRIPKPPATPQNPFFHPSDRTSDDDSTGILDPMTCPTHKLLRLGRNDEMTYNFRGKKVTKHYDDEDEDEEDDPNDLCLFAGREHLLPDPSVLHNLKPLRRKDILPRQLWPDDGPVPPKETNQVKPTEELTVEDEATDEEDAVETRETGAKLHGITSPPPEVPSSPRAVRNLRSQARRHVDAGVSPSKQGAGSNQPRTPFHNWLRKKKSADEQTSVTPTKREAEVTPLKREADDAPGSLPGPKRTRATTRQTQSA